MAQGIGARLRSARERSRLTILQAAEKLHVDPDILEALEAENFAALGAQVYVKGHLRHYAQLVGESTEALFDLYSQGARVPQPDLTRIPKALAPDAGRLVAPAVIVVIGFAAAGTVWWILSLSYRQWSAVAPRPVPITVDAAMPPAQQDALRLALVGGGASPVDATAPVASRAAAGALSNIDVVFTYSADSWTEVYDATGRRLLYGLSAAHAMRKLDGVPPLSVMLGDASDVSIEIGGHAQSISRFVRSDHTARFLIAADGRALAAPRKNGG
jgi:cytoskeleton protein RodZ